MEQLSESDEYEAIEKPTCGLLNALRKYTRAIVFGVTLLGASYAQARGPHHNSNVVDDSVDVIEVNHVYDAKGKHIFDQTIFYGWCDTECRYQVIAWRLLKHSSQHPIRIHEKDEYEAIWKDGIILRKVRSKAMRETWTQEDPELREREILPREHRRELTRFCPPLSNVQPNQ